MSTITLNRLLQLNAENKLIEKLIKWGAIPGERICCGEKMFLVQEPNREIPRFSCQKTSLVNGIKKR